MKQKAKLDGAKDGSPISVQEHELEDSLETDLLEDFPTSNQTTSESFLKAMMLALRTCTRTLHLHLTSLPLPLMT